MRCLVTGAGGFIGGHLVKRLLAEGHTVHCADVKPLGLWWQVHDGARNMQIDCTTRLLGSDCDEAYALACNMGGMGYIANNKFNCGLSTLITANTLRRLAGRCGRLFYSSSACVYSPDTWNLTEDSDTSRPEDGYGHEKLYGEQLCRWAREESKLETRVARYHNVYGPHGSWCDGREKAPAALCRKIAEWDLGIRDYIEVWGNASEGTYRSFMHVDDCIEGTLRLMRGDYPGPVNIGSAQMVSLQELVSRINSCATRRGTVEIRWVDGPRGVLGRCSENTLCRQMLGGWSPRIALEDGVKDLYTWVKQQVEKANLKA